MNLNLLRIFCANETAFARGNKWSRQLQTFGATGVGEEADTQTFATDGILSIVIEDVYTADADDDVIGCPKYVKEFMGSLDGGETLAVIGLTGMRRLVGPWTPFDDQANWEDWVRPVQWRGHIIDANYVAKALMAFPTTGEIQCGYVYNQRSKAQTWFARGHKVRAYLATRRNGEDNKVQEWPMDLSSITGPVF